MVDRKSTAHIVSGFLLLPAQRLAGYHGVDRNPFVPGLTKEAVESETPVERVGSFVWPFYSPGWERDAYRLYEENLVVGTPDNLSMLSDLKAGREVNKIISSHLGPHDLVQCIVCEIEGCRADMMPPRQGDLWGFDAAYRGGDFFSCLRAGLFGSPWFNDLPFPELVSKFGSCLNNYGLFSEPEIVSNYVREFKLAVPSELSATFWLWRLACVE